MFQAAFYKMLPFSCSSIRFHHVGLELPRGFDFPRGPLKQEGKNELEIHPVNAKL